MNPLMEERIKIEKLLGEVRPFFRYRFKEGNLIKLTFLVDVYEVDFLYPKERYEPKDNMVFKGIKIGSQYHSNGKKYSIVQLLSFFKNNCESFDESYQIDTLSESIINTKRLINILKENENTDWSVKIEELIKKKYPW